MFKISLKLDLEEFAKKMTDLEKTQVPFAAQLTINELAYRLSQTVVRDSMKKNFNKGATGWSQRASQYKPSRSKRDLRATVFLKGDRPYMRKLIEGGVVSPLKGMNNLIQPVTKNYKVNKYGNVTRNTIKRLSSNKKTYFYGRPGNKKNNTYGLYKRPTKKGGKFKLLLKVQEKSRGQKAFWDPTKESEKYVHRRFTMTFNKHFNKAMKTAR